MNYVIEGLDPAPFAPLFGMPDDALAEMGVVRMRADEAPGFPCRVTLDEVPVGDTLLLLNHESRMGDTPFRASHAIFVSEGCAAPARYCDELPPVMQSRWMSLRGFDADGMMVDARLTAPGEANAGLRELFADPRIVEIDAHNAVRGCFAARARRA
ncbi:DUF1203 domain-containing protein [Qipengyuania soli]|uniref:DUF1203 domain-containing protein n=1 Tax=Qipengyuania soli TaxID=2782568 RepID=A0A7S8F2I2_9SPHN|nr:DUF1203 domain-containing protein [Qipengyuania soli]QPC97944.1 DUF1203 domain-containing protein [Qipengyuania soli]